MSADNTVIFANTADDAEADPGGVMGLTPPPRTAQLIVKSGGKVLQLDYRCCK